jgi:hypothetical protein
VSGGLLPHLFTLTSESCEDILQVFLGDATVPFRGGLFSVALSVNEIAFRRPKPAFRVRSPGVTRRVALAPDDSGRCPDFPPARSPCDDPASDHPAHPLRTFYLEWQERSAEFGKRYSGDPHPFLFKDVILGELQTKTCKDVILNGLGSQGTPDELLTLLILRTWGYCSGYVT